MKSLTLEQIKKNLCYYDSRNPDNCIDEEEQNKNKTTCSCDNCFYGRTPLAEELLKQYDLSDDS